MAIDLAVASINDLDSERGALACVLSGINGESEKMMDELSESLFSDLRNLEIFRALIALQFDEKPLTTVALYQLLKDTNAVEDAGGFPYISTLEDASPSTANFPSFLGTVKDRARRRMALIEARDLERKALDLKAPMEATPHSDLEASLIARAFVPGKEPPPMIPVFTLCGHAVCTVGNLTSIVSQAKTGKSAVVGAMLAAGMTHPDSDVDLLGFQSSNREGKAIIHFDTEQSPDDFWHGVSLAIRRADIFDPPDWLLSYCLTGLLPRNSWQAVQAALRIAANRFGGIHSVLIDGVGDLVHDVNDAGECNDFVAALHGLAITHDCPIIGVLHFNPDTAKARGHLGSQLERKSESNLRLDKEDDGSTVLWSNKQRRAAIARDFGPRFRWSDEAHMHVTVESRSESRLGSKADGQIPYRDDVFMNHGSLRYSELKEAMKTTLKLSEKTAERRIGEWRKLKIIDKTGAGLWIPTT